jgi:hypothetical protein
LTVTIKTAFPDDVMKTITHKIFGVACLVAFGSLIVTPLQAARSGGGSFTIIVVNPKPVVSRF